MAVLETIKSLFIPSVSTTEETIVPAPPTQYLIKPLTSEHIKDVLRLNLRCFTAGDSYNKHTLAYLLNDPRTLSYQTVAADGELVAFAFVMVNANGAAHLTTIGVAPEHRRRGIADEMLAHIEKKVRQKEITTVMLEVRVGNNAAQQLYGRAGYNVVQRIAAYYNNGEDCYLMMKSLV